MVSLELCSVMPVIKINYLASFQALTGKESERYPIDNGEPLESLKRKLTSKYGENFERQLNTDLAIVFLNGNETSENPTLNDNDESSFAILFRGG